MPEPSLWEFVGGYDEEGTLAKLEIIEIIDIESEVWKYVLFLEEQYERYGKDWDFIAGIS